MGLQRCLMQNPMNHGTTAMCTSVDSNTRHLTNTRVRISGTSALEAELHRKLRLSGRGGLLELPEGCRRIRRIRARRKNVVDVDEVGAVEKIEHLGNPLDAAASAERPSATETHVDGGLNGQCPRVPANGRRQIPGHLERAIGRWNRAAVAVAVEIGAGQN